MARPKWFINLLIKSFRLRFLFAKLTRIPGIRLLVDDLLFKDDDIYFLLKDEVFLQQRNKKIKINQKIKTQNDIALPSKIVHNFIEKANHHWIMNFCLCRTANHCKNYPSEIGCLFLGEAVLKIDPDLGRLVSKEEAHKHIEKCRENGLIHLIGRNKLDAEWLDVKPGNKLMTICNCCECCCLWKMIPDLDLKISRKITKLPGIKIIVNENCTGCKTCLENICFVNAISISENNAIINQDLCRGCGRCIEICPNDSIEIKILDENFILNSQNRVEKIIDLS
ncbi:MAG: 4Fe-4S ferredoxin [Asgard group archaeon]|nr:4Fe-4S ferredoxin [Asgard group archaeon]